MATWAAWATWLILIAATVALAVFSLNGSDPDGAGLIGRLNNDQSIRVLLGIGFLLLIGLPALRMYRGRLSQAARDLSVWAGLAAVLVAGYSFRDEFRQIGYRVIGDLMPPGEAQTVERRPGDGQPGDQAVRIRKRADGHFVAKTEVNGVTVSMLVDTGASSVVLKPADARLAGVDVDRLTYSVPVQTANGTAYAAAVRLKRLSVGGITVDGIEALVAKPGTLGESLLGMTFLRRLRSYEFSGEFLTLRS
jgi:aspartyl protease family protein